jgi:predicted RNA-binding protein YlqC (UPF0109 family)
VSPLGDVADVLARALADQPHAVNVTETDHHGITLVEVFVAPDDVGKLVGRQGRTIAALRTLVTATAERLGKKVTLEVRERR